MRKLGGGVAASGVTAKIMAAKMTKRRHRDLMKNSGDVMAIGVIMAAAGSALINTTIFWYIYYSLSMTANDISAAA